MVTETFLPEYIKLIEEEIQKAANCIRLHRKKVGASINKIVIKAKAAKGEEEIRKLMEI